MEHNYQRSPEEVPQPQEENDASARLKADPQQENMLLRLRIVDRVLSAAPMLAPSPQFAEKVMGLLRRHRPFNHNAGNGIALGFTAVIVSILPLLILVLLVALVILLNWTAVYQGLLDGVGVAAGSMEQGIAGLQQFISDAPLIPALTLLSLPLFALWVWIMRKLATKTEKGQ